MHRQMFLADRGLACVWNLGDHHKEDTQIEARRKTRHVAACGILREESLGWKAKFYIRLILEMMAFLTPLRLTILIII